MKYSSLIQLISVVAINTALISGFYSRSIVQRHSRRFCIDKVLSPLPKDETEGYRGDSDNSWRTPTTTVECFPRGKFDVRPELVTFDPYNTLIEPSQSIGRWYREALHTVCGMRIRLPRPSLFAASFEVAFARMSDLHPCFGATTGMSCRDWWFQVVFDTFRKTRDLTQIDDSELEAIMPEVFELLYDTIFSTKLGWRVKENAEYTLTKLRDWRDLGSGPKIGVLSNSDDRLWGVLQDLDLAQYFDFAITSYEAKSQKPDSQLFEMAAQRAKVSTPRAAYHIGTDVDTDAAGAVSAGWTPLIFRQWFDESFPDWYAIETVEEADQGFQKRKAYMDWGRRDPARGGLEWIETWDLDDVLYLSGLPEDPEKPIHTTYLRGFLTDQKDSG